MCPRKIIPNIGIYIMGSIILCFLELERKSINMLKSTSKRRQHTKGLMGFLRSTHQGWVIWSEKKLSFSVKNHPWGGSWRTWAVCFSFFFFEGKSGNKWFRDVFFCGLDQRFFLFSVFGWNVSRSLVRFRNEIYWRISELWFFYLGITHFFGSNWNCFLFLWLKWHS